ncbi:ABC transporter permease [Desulforhopalus singaporensis]|uniref:ABC-2 type transport system permease protein n=1 Tax=Desulforhopalus singaporensis TaxID=91360 RepID=A0A1H0M524_9BACT|nr:ABC transporter permease [Desulforhopalus singaporensis]SDO75477.1 ABC-2 type transport system permease protein [Desulforhopalus singaporensis]
MIVLRRILALVVKEFTLIMKDPKSRFVIIGPPLIQFFVFGYAATYDLKNVRYAVLDQSGSALSRQFLAKVEGSGVFRLTGMLHDQQQIAEYIDGEKSRLVIHIDDTFAEKVRRSVPVKIQVIADGRNPNVALIALGYLGTIVHQFNEELVHQGVVQPGSSGLLLEERAWFNGNLRSRWFIVSALGGLISMVVVMILTSLSVAREREFGTFDQLLVAPFTPAEILVGKSLPGIIFGFGDAMIFAAGAVYWFGVPFRGTIAALAVALLCFIVTMVGVGLLVSSLSMTMQQGLLGSFVFIMPAVTLSGLATPVENMPPWLQQADMINPVRYIIIALRSIFLEGADLAAVWPHIWPLMIIASLTLTLAAWMFRARSV